MTGAGQRDVQALLSLMERQTDVEPDRPARRGAMHQRACAVLTCFAPLHLLLSPCGTRDSCRDELDNCGRGNTVGSAFWTCSGDTPVQLTGMRRFSLSRAHIAAWFARSAPTSRLYRASVDGRCSILFSHRGLWTVRDLLEQWGWREPI